MFRLWNSAQLQVGLCGWLSFSKLFKDIINQIWESWNEYLSQCVNTSESSYEPKYTFLFVWLGLFAEDITDCSTVLLH